MRLAWRLYTACFCPLVLKLQQSHLKLALFGVRNYFTNSFRENGARGSDGTGPGLQRPPTD